MLLLSVVATVLSVLKATDATWSLVMADIETREISVSSVTCVSNLDLKALLPVVLVGVGAACVQAAGDYSGTRRPIIHDMLLEGATPDEILDELEATHSNHQSMQYGILSLDVPLADATATFTGRSTAAWAGGYTGIIVCVSPLSPSPLFAPSLTE